MLSEVPVVWGARTQPRVRLAQATLAPRSAWAPLSAAALGIPCPTNTTNRAALTDPLPCWGLHLAKSAQSGASALSPESLGLY